MGEQDARRGDQSSPSSSIMPSADQRERKTPRTGSSGLSATAAAGLRKWMVRSIVGANAGAVSTVNAAGSQPSA